MVKYEHDVITSDSDVIAPDSHVTSTAPSPYADFAGQVCVITARRYSERDIATANCPSVRLSVCDVELSLSHRLDYFENYFMAD